jgi:apolipoprotein D and lipocalin family protein
MTVITMLLMVCLVAPDLAAQEGDRKELITVPKVDFGRYVGRWYEVARLPNRFQEKCAGDVTATYTLLDDGRIEVLNRCRREDGEYSTAEGIAKLAVEDGSNAKLKVRFAPAILSFLPFVWGDYWIIDLAPDYSYAVVGEPGRKYLWVLSRSPMMDDKNLDSILVRTGKQGYDVTQIIRTTNDR